MINIWLTLQSGNQMHSPERVDFESVKWQSHAYPSGNA